jgi:hypothetical protein
MLRKLVVHVRKIHFPTVYLGCEKIDFLSPFRNKALCRRLSEAFALTSVRAFCSRQVTKPVSTLHYVPWQIADS